ncbi:MAG TPA: hypothetical protein VGG75_34525 [Trebonia sp.]|jgi:hypothetical protein
MYDPPGYLWAITLVGVVAIPVATCAVLFSGAMRAGAGRRRAALLGAAAGGVLAAWFAASGVIADHGWYQAKLGHGVPWLPVAALGFLALLLVLRRVPSVARALTAPGMVSRLEVPHAFRLVGVVFLITMALGHLPALFAVPAGIGDVATAMAAPFVVRGLARGSGRRAALWLNAFGMTDLVLAIGLGALTGFQLIAVNPSAAPITQLPLALIPTAVVPLLFALHVTSVSALTKAPLRATVPLPA